MSEVLTTETVGGCIAAEKFHRSHTIPGMTAQNLNFTCEEFMVFMIFHM